MFGKFFGQRHSTIEPPIEMRFVDLFMIIVTALMFMIVMLSIVSAFVGGSNALAEVSPRILTVELPAGLANRPYSITLAGTGGSNPYSWRINSGSLPFGLKLDEAKGTVSGTPRKLQQTQFTISLIDHDNRSSQKEFSLEILQVGLQQIEIQHDLYILGDAVHISDGQVDVPYSFQLSVFGGTPPYSWNLVNGELPKGLNLTADGQITGNPIDSSVTNFDVNAKDSEGETVNQKVYITINPAATPIWQRVFTYLEIGLRIIAYLLLAIILYTVLFVDQEDRVVHQLARKSPWTKLRERFRK